jgi:hypothetical protein
MMEIAKRKLFLDSFLKLLGAESITWKRFEIHKVYGTVVYGKNDPSEQQDFCWHMMEENTPSGNVVNLINVIKDNNFIDIDRLRVPLTEIFKKTDENNYDDFVIIVQELMNVQVFMIDEGIETDSYFIHD